MYRDQPKLTERKTVARCTVTYTQRYPMIWWVASSLALRHSKPCSLQAGSRGMLFNKSQDCKQMRCGQRQQLISRASFIADPLEAQTITI